MNTATVLLGNTKVKIPREKLKNLELKENKRVSPRLFGKILQGLGKEIWRKNGGASSHLQRERSTWDKTN